MIKNKYIDSTKDLQEMFTFVEIKEYAIKNLPQEIKDDWGIDDEWCTSFSLADANELAMRGQIDYSDIVYDFCDWDEWAYKDFIHELVKKAEHYLVFLPNSTWTGANGCGIVNSLEDAFYRDYDCKQYVKAVSKGNKAVLLKEYHHDVPMGHHVVIVALTDREYNKLENADFKTLEDFALNYLKSLETSKKELYKTLANI